MHSPPRAHVVGLRGILRTTYTTTPGFGSSSSHMTYACPHPGTDSTARARIPVRPRQRRKASSARPFRCPLSLSTGAAAWSARQSPRATEGRPQAHKLERQHPAWTAMLRERYGNENRGACGADRCLDHGGTQDHADCVETGNDEQPGGKQPLDVSRIATLDHPM